MDISFWFYLSSGLFLGWSLGASDAANIFGTAVGTKMVKFRTAAIISSLFITIGAVYAGSGASQTLGTLGTINALAGAFMAALAAALTIYWTVKLSLPVSTSQAIVGAIIGWNLFAGKPTDITVLSKIIGTWIFCPDLTGLIAILLYYPPLPHLPHPTRLLHPCRINSGWRFWGLCSGSQQYRQCDGCVCLLKPITGG